jgi:hypothetical protein
MRKILIIVVLLLNISFHEKDFKINLCIGNYASAQCESWLQYMYQYNLLGGGPGPAGAIPPATNTGTTPGWWSSFTSWMGTAGYSIGQLFNGQGTTTFHSPNQYPGFGGSIYPPGYFNQYNNNGGGGGGSSSSSTQTIDCAGVAGGTAKIDACGICSGGSTGADSCNKPLFNDTLKPAKIPCLPGAVARDTLSDYIINYIKDAPITKNARDSAPFRNFETGFSIRRYSNPSGTQYIYQPKDYNSTTGVTQSAVIANLYPAIADFHTHTDTSANGTKILESPSPRDIYTLLDQSVDPYFINKFQRKFVLSGASTAGEFALVVSDTTKVRQFLLSNPEDSVINVNQSSPFANNWKGTESTGFYKKFNDAKDKFRKEGYPENNIETYANVYILETFNLGLKLQQKVDGKFKELSFVEETDPLTNKKHYRIKICD